MTPLGSRENLQSPQSPENQRNDWSRKSSLLNTTETLNRSTISQDDGQDQKQSTSEIFKDMLSQKRHMIMSKITSFDSDVSPKSVSEINTINFVNENHKVRT